MPDENAFIKEAKQSIHDIQLGVGEIRVSMNHQSQIMLDMKTRNESLLQDHNARITMLEKIAHKTEGGISTLNKVLTLTTSAILATFVWVASSIIENNKSTSVHQKDLARIDTALHELQLEVQALQKAK